MAQRSALVQATSMTGLQPVCALHNWSVAALVGPLRNRPYKARSRRARAHCVASDDERSVWAPCANVARLARRRRLGVEAGRVGALVQVLRKAGCCHLQRKAVAGQLASVGRSPTQHHLLRVRCTCWDCRELDLQRRGPADNTPFVRRATMRMPRTSGCRPTLRRISSRRGDALARTTVRLFSNGTACKIMTTSKGVLLHKAGPFTTVRAANTTQASTRATTRHSASVHPW